MPIDSLFKGLADRTRLRILNLLLTGELCGCDLQYVLAISQPNVSRHLTYLKRAGLVLDRRDGYRVFYRLAEAESTDVALLAGYLRRSFRGDKSLERDRRTLKAAIRKGACTISEVPALLITARTPAGARARRRS